MRSAHSSSFSSSSSSVPVDGHPAVEPPLHGTILLRRVLGGRTPPTTCTQKAYGAPPHLPPRHLPPRLVLRKKNSCCLLGLFCLLRFFRGLALLSGAPGPDLGSLYPLANAWNTGRAFSCRFSHEEHGSSTTFRKDWPTLPAGRRGLICRSRADLS